MYIQPLQGLLLWFKHNKCNSRISLEKQATSTNTFKKHVRITLRSKISHRDEKNRKT